MESQLTRYRSIFAPGADAGFRVRGGASGVSRISARGVLKVRPHTKRGGGGGGGGQSTSGPIYEKWGGGGGGGAIRFRSDTKSGGGRGQSAPGPIYEKWGGGQFASGPIRKVGGGGGGGPFRFRSDTFVWHTENSYMYLPTCYLGILHTRARMNVKYMQAKVNLFVIHMLGGRAPSTPPLNPPLCSTSSSLPDRSSLVLSPSVDDVI